MGNFTRIDNVHGSVTGWTPDRPGSGTYQVNPDCTAATQFQPAPGAPVIEERIVIVDGGTELHSITVSPLFLMVDRRQEDCPSVKTKPLDVSEYRKSIGAIALTH